MGRVRWRGSGASDAAVLQNLPQLGLPAAAPLINAPQKVGHEVWNARWLTPEGVSLLACDGMANLHACARGTRATEWHCALSLWAALPPPTPQPPGLFSAPLEALQLCSTTRC
eukprot:361135-Chlamydomonas_euryale.AAC.4